MSVVGARPNFMKIAPFVHAVNRHNSGEPCRDKPANAQGERRIQHCLVHTGQHYDAAMSEAFFDALDIPRPDVDLGVGSGTHAEQVGQTMMAFEPVARSWRPDWIVIVGDVNATCACSVTAKKERTRLAHIEAGLRSRDLDMPEEINRMVADRLSDLLFTTDDIAGANLRAEGVPEEKICLVGNIMVDTLDAHRPSAEKLNVAEILGQAEVGGRKSEVGGRGSDGEKGYTVLTLHRPSNVDDEGVLRRLVDFLAEEVAGRIPLVWTLHPRTENRLNEFGLMQRVQDAGGICLVPPLGYHELLRLTMDAKVFLTDSGGLQEECCVLGTPCITLRKNTERPVTLREHGGTCELGGNDPDRIRALLDEMLRMERRPHRPPLWDGHTAERIVTELVQRG